MKQGIILTIIFILNAYFLYSGNLVKFFEVQNFEPALFYETSIISDDAKLIYWKNGQLFYKEIFKKNAKWKKLKNFNPEEFFIRVDRQGKINLLPITFISNFFFSNNKPICAFTTGLGSTPNMTVVVVDKSKNKVIFTPVLKELEDKKRTFGIFMENVWFNPVISEDEKLMVCDGYRWDGSRNSALFDIENKKLIKEFSNSAYPYIKKNKVYFLKETRKENSIFLSVYDIAKKQEKHGRKVTGRIVGLKILNETGLLVTDKNIYEFDVNEIEKNKNVIDFNDYFKSFQSYSIEQVYSCMFKENPYLFVVVKGYKDNQYEWKLYCYKM